ncbi:flavin reductase family protein [Thermobifida halotolerans]|nr:flavin reductase family protein [Thermobifida halotolerans]
MRLFPTGVAVLLAGHESTAIATTVNSLTSISLDPPTILVSLHETSRAVRIIDATGEFRLSFLSGDQEDQARLFASSDKPTGERLAPYLTATPVGFRILDGAIAGVACEVVSVRQESDHHVYLGRVTATHLGDTAHSALLFHHGRMTPA